MLATEPDMPDGPSWCMLLYPAIHAHVYMMGQVNEKHSHVAVWGLLTDK